MNDHPLSPPPGTAGPADRSRRVMLAALAGVASGFLPTRAAAGRRLSSSLPPMVVFKGPSCTCCEDWIATVRSAGFNVTAHDEGNAVAHARVGMPTHFASCHTGLVAGYAVEGHVPVREIKRLLKERPRAMGLAVPGMPVGTPGMDGPQYGGRQDPYEVLLIGHNGKASVFQRYGRGGPTADGHEG